MKLKFSQSFAGTVSLDYPENEDTQFLGNFCVYFLFNFTEDCSQIDNFKSVMCLLDHSATIPYCLLAAQYRHLN